MIKLLVWLAGSYGLLYLAWRFATWQLLVQLLVLAALFLWVVGGGLLLAYRVKRGAVGKRDSAADRAALTADRVRAAHVATYGEMSARACEASNPEVWEGMARAQRVAK